MVEKTKDEWTSGYDGIWMNEEDNNASGPLMDINSSTWTNKRKVIINWMGCSKKWLFNIKMIGYPKRKNRKREWPLNFLAFKVSWQCICVLCLQCGLQHEWRERIWKIIKNNKRRSIESCKMWESVIWHFSQQLIFYVSL